MREEALDFELLDFELLDFELLDFELLDFELLDLALACKLELDHSVPLERNDNLNHSTYNNRRDLPRRLAL